MISKKIRFKEKSMSQRLTANKARQLSLSASSRQGQVYYSDEVIQNVVDYILSEVGIMAKQGGQKLTLDPFVELNVETRDQKQRYVIIRDIVDPLINELRKLNYIVSSSDYDLEISW